MIEFEKPNIECLEINESCNYAKFVCEPLERGYGVTIGNSFKKNITIITSWLRYYKCKN